ncbi:MAG TPA: amidohydrolase family protein [Calditrichia bacterium]|nr:amidohydrolase family protein [Calditrichota bacterium]HQV31119.1 amidohydrolase family protein [Calditrichia bacterium]
MHKRIFSRMATALFLWATLAGCAKDKSEAVEYYQLADFRAVPKIDAHVHMNTGGEAFVKLAAENNFRLLTINVDYPDFPPIAEQLAVARGLLAAAPERVAFVSTFSMNGWGEPEWLGETERHLDQTFADGALGVKVWKNIGMAFRDANGENVMIDDPGFDPLFAFIKSRGKVLVGHQGEPKNCWLPAEEMTVNNDREYFKNHPQYHMYQHPEEPSYEEHMAARDRMLAKNEGLPFMGAHLASLEWSVAELAKFLDRFPNAVVDMAARMGQVQYQSAHDREAVRNFLIQYQDRILYATDLTHGAEEDPEAFAGAALAKWQADWRYLVSDDQMEVPEVNGPFQGLKLPKSVVDKLYAGNARRIFPGAFSGS